MSSSTADLPSLTPNQINALVVLMVEARKLTNAELQELAGFTLTGKDNKKLVELGLVETDRNHRPFSHDLTEEGWRVMRELHTAAPPKAGRSASRSLFTLLTNLHRGLDRLRISHGDFFKQTGAEPATEVAPTSPTEVAPTPARSSVGGDTEALVRAAYRELAARPGAWVGLADLRDHLGGADRAAVDTALRALVRQDGVRIIPVANSKSLTVRDRAAAVRIGDEDNHMLAIGAA
ncbi:hypothetical protein OOK41_10485 [Micromonospora sp. NBC_01655]|uniref:hypothetical protein n=1 Tax=Micromonospora sp. NBC_01655 TaxID=2975983 RepID=UPI0022530F7B|nr:hypothetical protein [Micromonospora sp. NBC_01655]MCX4470727.1 hypothetical protein [Micromonospora sp. NBC_01655]